MLGTVALGLLRRVVGVDGAAAPHLALAADAVDSSALTASWRTVVDDVANHDQSKARDEKVEPIHDGGQDDEDNSRDQGVLIFQAELSRTRAAPWGSRTAALRGRVGASGLIAGLPTSPFENFLDFLFVTLPAHAVRRPG